MLEEDFNRKVSIDFSKLSKREFQDAVERISAIYPELSGILKIAEENWQPELTVDDVFQLMSDTMPCDDAAQYIPKGWANLCKIIDRVHPGVIASLILRTIAIKMDEQYPDHISKCPLVYVYNSMNGGRICELDTSSISRKTWKYFAAFRTQEDAVAAVKLMHAVKHAIYK